jgi:hypothetical protein
MSFSGLLRPRILIVAALCGLGVNGLVQVGLQRDMGSKTTLLSSQVQAAQAQSAQMKQSLSGLQQLQKSTKHMASTLSTLSSATSDMDNGLSILENAVVGISDSIAQLGGSTTMSGQQIQSAIQSASKLVGTLNQIQQLNGDVVSHLSQMVNDQAAINNNLSELNQKTAVIP